MNISRCRTDITIDTCVLAHACNRNVSYYPSAVALLTALQEGDLEWVLDDNGKAAPAVETSLLYAEYRQTLSPQSLPLVLLASFLSFGRVHFAPRPDQALREAIRRLVPRNRRDQVVLGAAATSHDRVLVTNDSSDFPDDIRERAAVEIGVGIFESSEL